MKKNKLQFNLILLLGLITMAGCFSSQQTMKLNSIELTNQLHVGMTYSEVEALLGKPKSSHSSSEQLFVRWNLQEMWKGYIPYDLVFNAADKRLISWSENSKAFEQQQVQLAVVATEMQKMEQTQAAKSSGGGPAANFKNDPTLMKYFQGAYYHFSSSSVGTGGTEKEISLCPNGSYFSSSESGYSGGAGTSGAWGTNSQGGGGGTWIITGTKTEGTIAITNSSGETTTYKFSVCGDGCIYLGNTKYGYNGDPKCR